MSKEELWEALCERYPDFKDEEHIVKQRARGLKRLLDQAWDEGHTKGVANGKAIESMKRDAEAKLQEERDLWRNGAGKPIPADLRAFCGERLVQSREERALICDVLFA